MSWFSRLFATDKAIDSLVDKDKGLLVRAGSWVDSFSYTDEEKAKSAAETREWGLRQLEALQPFKVVQRILAFAAATLWIVVALNVLVAIWIESIYGIEVTETMFRFALSDYIWWPVMTVFGLYFAGGVLPRKS